MQPMIESPDSMYADHYDDLQHIDASHGRAAAEAYAPEERKPLVALDAGTGSSIITSTNSESGGRPRRSRRAAAREVAREVVREIQQTDPSAAAGIGESVDA